MHEGERRIRPHVVMVALALRSLAPLTDWRARMTTTTASSTRFFIKFPSFLADENYVKEADAGALLLARRTDSPVWIFYLYIKALSVDTCHAKFEHRFVLEMLGHPIIRPSFLSGGGHFRALKA